MKRKIHASDSSPSAARTAASSPAPTPLRKIAPFALLVLLAVVGYVNIDSEEFFFDSLAIYRSPPGQVGQAVKSLIQTALAPGSELASVTFACNHALNRALGRDDYDITSFIIVNVILHALNVCLLYALVRALLRQVDASQQHVVWVPLAAAMLFAVHPLHATSVVYILQRRGLMTALFYLLALLAYLRLRIARGWRARVALAGLIALCFWLGCKSKTMGLTLPVALLALEFCLRAPEWPALKRYLLWLLPGLVLCLAGMLAFLWSRGLFDVAQFRILPWGPSDLWGAWPHFLTESRVFWHYWKLILLPLPHWMAIDHSIAVSYGFWEHAAWLALSAHVLVLGLALLAARRRYTLAAFGLLLFYVALIPWALLPQKELCVEYKTYLSSAGAALLLAEVFWRLRTRVPLTAQVVVVAALTVLLLATTVHRNPIYRNSLSLWKNVVQVHPDHPRGLRNYGVELGRRGQLDEAVAAFRRGLRVEPDNDAIRRNLANVLEKQGESEQALEHYRELLQHDPEWAEVRVEAGIALASLGRFDEAASEFQAAVQVKREGGLDSALMGHGYKRLASAYFKQRKLEKAVEAYRESLRFRPLDYSVHYDMALALQRLGRSDEAIAQYAEAIRVRPSYAEAHINRGSLLAAQSRFDEAIVELCAALDGRPEHESPESVKAKANLQLGNVRFSQEAWAEAVEAYTAALQFAPGNPQVHYALGAALQRLGRTGDAVEQYRATLRLQPNHARARRALEALLQDHGG